MTQILLSYVFFVPQISQIYTDLDLFGLWDDADFSSSDYAELSDTFVLHGLRTEFKRKATCSVVEPELHDV